MSSLFQDPRMQRRPKIEFNRVGLQSSQGGFSGGGLNTNSGIRITQHAPVLMGVPRPSGFSIRPTTPIQQQIEEQERPKAVFWDEQGRLLDDKGNIINLKSSSELKINQKSQKDNKTKDLLKLKKFGESQASSSALLAKRQFFDTSLDNKLNKRDRKKTGAFNFVQEGTFIKRGEILRKKQVLQEYEQKVAGETEEIKGELGQAGVESLVDKQNDGKIHVRKSMNLRSVDPTPDVEWWDVAFLPPMPKQLEDREDTNAAGQVEPPKRFPYPHIDDSDIYLEKITHYIQHPKKLRNEYIENINKMVIPIHLTEKERKKLRRMKRVEKEKDKQEKVKLGLMPPPLPKVKLSNYMKIMSKEAIADPSRVEQKVKQIVEQRLETHLKRNEENKLTRDQREAKMKRKHERDIQQNECRIAVFKVENFTQPHLKFKVNMNAQQFHMGGFCLIADQQMAPDLPNLVIVEGGPTAIKRFKRLMLRRIDWNSKAKSKKPHASQDEEGGEHHEQVQEAENEEEKEDSIKYSKDRKCFLIWEGLQRKKAFEKWRVVDIRSENEAKRLLGEKGCEHFWNMAITFQPERAEGEEPEHLDKVLA